MPRPSQSNPSLNSYLFTLRNNMSPAQVLGQLKSAEIKIYSDNLRHRTNWSTENLHFETLKTPHPSKSSWMCEIKGRWNH